MQFVGPYTLSDERSPLLIQRLESVPGPDQSSSRPAPVHTAAITPLQQTPQLPHIATSVSTYNDASSMRSSVSTSSNYTASPHAPRHTPPTPQANFLSQVTSFSPVNAFPQRQNNVQNLPNLPQDDKFGLAYLLHSRHHSGDRAQGMRQNRTASGSSPSILPMNTLNPVPGANTIDAQQAVIPACAVPIRNIPSTCPLDGLLLDFLADRRQQALDGVPTQELTGPLYPSFLSLINPQRKQTSHPLSKVFTDMMSTFPDISTLPEQVAILYVDHHPNFSRIRSMGSHSLVTSCS